MKIVLSILLILCFKTITAQSFSYRRGEIRLNDQTLFTYKNNPFKNQWTLCSSDGMQTILVITENNNETIDDPSDDFYTVLVQQFYIPKNDELFYEDNLNPYFNFRSSKVISFKQAFEKMFQAGLFNGNQIDAEKWTNEWAEPLIMIEIQSR